MPSGERPPRSLSRNARTALPSRAEAAARNGLAEGAEPEPEPEPEPEEEDEQVRLLSSSLTAGCSLRSPSGREAEPGEDRTIRYVRYESELQMPDIMRLITKDLSEPYSIYTYRYFIHNWPQLCFLVSARKEKRVLPQPGAGGAGQGVCGPRGRSPLRVGMCSACPRFLASARSRFEGKTSPPGLAGDPCRCAAPVGCVVLTGGGAGCGRGSRVPWT